MNNVGDERIDKARNVMERFQKDLQSLDTNESYVNFALRFFQTERARTFVLNVATAADIRGTRVHDMPSFRHYFKFVARTEFTAKVGGFMDEEIRLGLML